MKSLFYFLILSPIFFNAAFAGNPQKFACNNAGSVSNMFEYNWKKNPRGEYYWSTVQDSTTGVEFNGSVHSGGHYFPKDKNPHLNLVNVGASRIHNNWWIICYFNINNSQIISDENVNTLKMTHQVPLDQFENCHKIDGKTVECK